MKKFLFFALALLALASCDDTKKSAPKPSGTQLSGTWGIVDYITVRFDADGAASARTADGQTVALTYEYDPDSRMLHLEGDMVDGYAEIREKTDKLLTVYTVAGAASGGQIFYDGKYLLPRLTDNGSAYAGENLNGTADALVGKWVAFGDEADGETTVTFRTDGKVEMYDAEYDETDICSYGYNPETKTLTLYAYGDVETGVVELVNDEAAIIYESYYDPEDGTTESYYMMLKRIE